MTLPHESPPGLWQRRPVRRALRNWLDRHQHPVNFWIHLAGIPLACAGVALLFVLPWSACYWALAALVGGYVLQFIGHRVEGNDMGEWAGIKRLLGLPYVSIAPRRQNTADDGRQEKV